MSDLERKFHEEWLGMVQPIEGLVFSVPVLCDAQVMNRHGPELTARLQESAPGGRIADLDAFLDRVLELRPALFDRGDALPEDLKLWIPEGHQLLRPTLALRRRGELRAPEREGLLPDDSTPESRAGAGYLMLVWDVEPGLDLDKAETVTGPWHYPTTAKLERLLRATRVPIGLITNREVVRLVYAPHGESSGWITFRIADMSTVGGRPILDAFVELLGGRRFFGVSEERTLPALLRESRLRQANVTTELAEQVFEALQDLLQGFEAAAGRDQVAGFDDAVRRDPESVYGGLLTVALRLVFALYAEDRGLLPVDKPHYARHLSLLGLFEQLQADNGQFPDSMSRRFGAWPRLVALFRAIFLGVRHGELEMPARRGELFDPHRYPFLEGWEPAGAAPIGDPVAQAQVQVPRIDDGTVFRVLEKLLVFEGQRLSYRALDVEQIGSVYEALMGFHVIRMPSQAVQVRAGKARVWVAASDVIEQRTAGKAQLVRWLADDVGLQKKAAERIAEAVRTNASEEEALAALESVRVKGAEAVGAGRLVLQPGSERRRTSSHYTPRSLSAPIVRRTLEPLLAAMGGTPSSEQLLQLKICDPAMGSGAFLVEACRFLADQVVAAWTREGKVEREGDPVLHARRLVAQKCLYGVDKNPFAVGLAKLSLWLTTFAKDEPFTFVDHALRHGDSLVGLTVDQIARFHWAPRDQVGLWEREIETALQQALVHRVAILALADSEDTRQKERLLEDAEGALARAKLLGDLVVGAFFAEEKDRARDAERTRRFTAALLWVQSGGEPPAELRALQAEIRERIPVFHWQLEFPEVFWEARPDPLEKGRVNRSAWFDAFVGNPPFMGGGQVSGAFGEPYRDWLLTLHAGAHGNADLCAHFFRRAADLIGKHGTFGLIATNTIAQGDTRQTGLQLLVQDGNEIYDATRSLLWPGEANVAVAVVHLARGALTQMTGLERRLDGKHVPIINSRLRPSPDRPDPARLRSNAGCSYLGSKIYGEGFTSRQRSARGCCSKILRMPNECFHTSEARK